MNPSNYSESSINTCIQSQLCTGCGTCAGVCPNNAISIRLDHGKGVYVPEIENQKCADCGICYSVCPGHSIDFNTFDNFEGYEYQNSIFGSCKSSYSGYATDANVRLHSSSGGIVTALLSFALNEGIIDGALVTRMDSANPFEPEPFIATSPNEIFSAAQSKYCPVPTNKALKELLKKNGKFGVVGLPCHIQGIRKAEKKNQQLKEKIVFHLAISCGHNDTFLATEYILARNKIPASDVICLEYRGTGWPGIMKIVLRDGTEKRIPYHSFIQSHELYFFAMSRCRFCGDSLGRLADITVMDAWLPEFTKTDKLGHSMILTRTQTGEQIVQNATRNRIVHVNCIPLEKLIRSRGRHKLSNKDLSAHMAVAKFLRMPVPKYSISIPKYDFVNFARAICIFFNIIISSRRGMMRITGAIIWIELLVLKMFEKPLREENHM
jgi:coenzyme F420 hydrogenase subunit beta